MILAICKYCHLGRATLPLPVEIDSGLCKSMGTLKKNTRNGQGLLGNLHEAVASKLVFTDWPAYITVSSETP